MGWNPSASFPSPASVDWLQDSVFSDEKRLRARNNPNQNTSKYTALWL